MKVKIQINKRNTETSLCQLQVEPSTTIEKLKKLIQEKSKKKAQFSQMLTL